MRRALLAGVTLAAWCGIGHAAERTYPSPLDHHIRSVYYNERNVTKIYGTPGNAVDVVLQRGEFARWRVIGNTKAWDVKGVGRDIFIKPLAGACIDPKPEGGCAAYGNSSLTVITNKRRYEMELIFIPNHNSPLATIELSFRYPDDEKQEAGRGKINEALTQPNPGALYNLDYTRSAKLPSLGLLHAWDNGQFTYFEFAPNAPLPAIYFWGPGKKEESMANTVTEGPGDNILVVPSVAKQFILRLDGQYTGVFNEDYQNERFMNTSGTSSPFVRRVTVQASQEPGV